MQRAKRRNYLHLGGTGRRRRKGLTFQYRQSVREKRFSFYQAKESFESFAQQHPIIIIIALSMLSNLTSLHLTLLLLSPMAMQLSGCLFNTEWSRSWFMVDVDRFANLVDDGHLSARVKLTKASHAMLPSTATPNSRRVFFHSRPPQITHNNWLWRATQPWSVN